MDTVEIMRERGDRERGQILATLDSLAAPGDDTE